MGQRAFSALGQYVLDVDAAVQSQNQDGSVIYWRVLVYKNSGTGYHAAGNAGNNGAADSNVGGVNDLWSASGFAYDFRTSSGVPVGGYVMFSQGTFYLPHDASGYANYWVNGSMNLVNIGYSDTGSGTKSAPRIIRTPGAPTGVVFSSVTSTSMRTQFYGTTDGGSAITGWELQRATNASFTSDLVTLSSSGINDHTGLTPQTTYYFRARGRNDKGWGPYGETKSQTTLAAPNKPAAPVVSQITQNSFKANTVDPASNGSSIDARQVDISLDHLFSTVLSTKNAQSPTFDSSDGVSRVNTYYIRWRARNTTGWSQFSDTVSVSTPGTTPTAPAGYAATDIASTSAVVTLGTISDNGGAIPSQVRVKLSTTASDTGLLNTVTRSAWTPVQLFDLTKGTTYYVAEAAYNNVTNGGWGPYGEYVAFTTRTDVPNAPVVSLGDMGNDYGTIQWALPTELNGAVITTYRLRIFSDSGLSNMIRDLSVPASDLSAVIAGLAAGTTYHGYVWTLTTNGVGSVSTPFDFTTTGQSASTYALWMRLGGVWKHLELWMRIQGTWKRLELWTKVSGTWRKLN